MTLTNRIIGRFKGHEDGPLLIVIGGLHGNEIAGVKAIGNMLRILEVEPLANPNFRYRGYFMGLVGNLQALQNGQRFVDRDINRSFTTDQVNRIFAENPSDLKNEDKEIYELINIMKEEINRTGAQKVYILDLHTTTATGGIFTIPSASAESIEIASQLHAPVIIGFMESLVGTTLQFFTEEVLGVETTVVTFEAGQHEDTLSVHRSISAIAGYMRSIQSVNESDVESHHDELLIEYSEGLPKAAELFYTHSIKAEDKFVMMPGFKNFQAVANGELLAHDIRGEIRAQGDGMILMPLYQSKGEDGYFLIRNLSPGELKRKQYDMERAIHL